MTLDDLLVRVIDAFQVEQVPFMVIGGLAVVSWVEPRATKDMDVVVRIRRVDGRRLKRALSAAGTRATQVELRILLDKRFVRFKTGGPILDVRLCRTAHDISAFDRAEEVETFDRKFRVATPEDLVLYKLAAWRPLDQRDILVILRDIPDLDTAYLDAWLDRVAEDTGQPIRARWEGIRAEA